jgi:hypothetical protein
MKRMRSTDDQLRISRSGFDVDAAGPDGFLLHEDFLWSQPFFFKYIPCPFAGFTGAESRVEAVTEPIPDSGSVPIVTLYAVKDGAIAYPILRSMAFGNLQNGWPGLEQWHISYAASPTSLTIEFVKQVGTRTSPDGCYVICFRR